MSMRTLRWLLTAGFVGTALWVANVSGQIRPAPGASPNVSTAIGTLTAPHGGTGQTSYTIGDVLFASSSSALSKLAAVATGSVLVSAGTGTAPAYSANPVVTSITTGGSAASAGDVRVQNGGSIKFRNALNNGDVTGLNVNSSNNVVFGATIDINGNNIQNFAQLTGGAVAKVLIRGAGTNATQLSTTQTTVPTCSTNCGTSPSVAGTDTAGVVTMGSTGSPASGWVVTFNGTWAAAPSCNVTPAVATMAVGKIALAVVTSTTTFTVTTNGVAPATSDKYNYICVGVQ